MTTTAQALQPTIEASRHELVLEMTESQILVDADPVRISQVITNLLNNAVKFSPPKTRITLKLWRVEEYAFISVRDEGIGIRAEDLSSIFEMFRQLDQRLERVTGGLGIGLTLAKELVEKHGGAIEVHSEGVSRGSEFIVSLPLSARSTLNAPTPASSDEPNSIDSTHRILIADDNVPAATTLAEYFKLRGHETCAVFDGSSAVETGNFFKPDVVVLDIGMPNLNGYEAARAIRATDWGRKATILCLTGFGDERHQREARNAGFSMLFRKPVNPEEILEYLSHKPLPN